ncbi:MAG: AI-2E family transporter [Pseudomonadota bacterium]
MTESYKWRILFAGLFVGWVFYLLMPVLTPFLIGGLLAYLGDPIVDRLEARKIPRSLGVSIVFFLVALMTLLLLIVIIPVLTYQMQIAISQAPLIITWLQNDAVPNILERLGVESDINLELMSKALQDNWQGATEVAAKFLKALFSSSAHVILLLSNLVLIPVVAFYLLRDWDILVAQIDRLLPRTIRPTVVKITQECDEVIGQFLKGQLLVMFSLTIIYSVGLTLVGLDVALMVGILSGAVSFVPYLGTIIGILAATIAGLVQYQGEIASLIPIFIVYGVGQLIESYVLTPMMVGDKIGLHPVAVIFAIMAGGQLFGFAGVLLALPIAAVIVVLLRHGVGRYLRSGLYGAMKNG